MQVWKRGLQGPGEGKVGGTEMSQWAIGWVEAVHGDVGWVGGWMHAVQIRLNHNPANMVDRRDAQNSHAVIRSKRGERTEGADVH